MEVSSERLWILLLLYLLIALDIFPSDLWLGNFATENMIVHVCEPFLNLAFFDSQDLLLGNGLPQTRILPQRYEDSLVVGVKVSELH